MFVDEYNDTYHHSIDKKSVDPDNSALTKDIEINPKGPEFKVGDRIMMTK